MLINIRHDVDSLLRASQPKLTALSERLSSASLNSCVYFPHSQLRSCRLARICENAAVSAECGIKDENPTGGMRKITALGRRHRTACMGHDLLNSAAESHLILTHHFRTPHHEHHWSSPLEMDTPASRADRRWNTLHLGHAIAERRNEGLDVPPELLAHISPLGWAHILLTGEYLWPNGETA